MLVLVRFCYCLGSIQYQRELSDFCCQQLATQVLRLPKPEPERKDGVADAVSSFGTCTFATWKDMIHMIFYGHLRPTSFYIYICMCCMRSCWITWLLLATSNFRLCWSRRCAMHALCDIIVLWESALFVRWSAMGNGRGFFRLSGLQRYLSILCGAAMGLFVAAQHQIRCPWLFVVFPRWLLKTAKKRKTVTTMTITNNYEHTIWWKRPTPPPCPKLHARPRITQLRLGHGKVALQGRERLRRD